MAAFPPPGLARRPSTGPDLRFHGSIPTAAWWCWSASSTALGLGTRIRLWSNNQVYTSGTGGATPEPVPVERLERGRSGLCRRRYQAHLGHPHRRYHYRRRAPRAAPASRLRGNQAHGLLRALSRDASDYEAVRDALEKLQLNDSSLLLMSRKTRGAGLRLPLRFPGTAAYGNRAGTPGARV